MGSCCLPCYIHGPRGASRTHTIEKPLQVVKTYETNVFMGLKCAFCPPCYTVIFRKEWGLWRSHCLRVETFELHTKNHAALDSFV